MPAGEGNGGEADMELLRGRIDDGLTRRRLLGRAAQGAGSLALASQVWPRLAGAAAASGAPIGLPSPAQVRADFQTMVDFGPRLTGSDAHNRFIEWLEREFTAAGCELLPCDVYETSRWEAERFALDVLDGAAPGPVKVATYFPRSKETPAAGVTGPLVYGGTLPAPSINGPDPAAFQAGLARYPADIASWAQALPGTLGGSPQGSVLVVDVPAPVPITAGVLAGDMTFYNGQGETQADLLGSDYKRLWLVPGLAMPLDAFTALGVAGVVLIVDASFEALKGQYAPFESKNEDVPALYVDRDTGAALRAGAAARPKARLTLTATRRTVPSPTVTAVLPGQSKETLIFNTHTDGQGFVEENGPVAFVQLARHFASLPAGKRLKRTLVFANWPGHMSNDLPQVDGWIEAHRDLVDRAAAALTIEHLGCSEWSDTADRGYHATGRAELFAVWTTQGPMFEHTRDAVVAHDLPRTALMRPPAQFGVGSAFQGQGVPQIGAIAGPEYLLTISDDGELDKLDEALAARQIAWVADLATRLDGVDAATLRTGDPTLGAGAPKSPSAAADPPKTAQCGPPATFVVGAGSGTAGATAGRTLTIHWYGRRHAPGGMVIALNASRGRVKGVTVELRRQGRLVARSKPMAVGEAGRRVVLRRPGGGRFPDGAYTIVLRRGGRVIARRDV
ncbi:MAG: hypothetical protein JWM73_1416, partial [Solirubrobacterales bacterium]|nr:hypothetical protein [Solirubrobacterales bacterium]